MWNLELRDLARVIHKCDMITCDSIILAWRARGSGDKNDDSDEMDVEGALALDLAELEAMLAIDSEQVRYDEQVKEKDFEAEECSTACSSTDACNSQKHRRRGGTKNRVSEKTDSSPLFLISDDKLENVDPVNRDNRISASTVTTDNIRLQDSIDFRLSLPLTTPSPEIRDSSSIFTKPTPPDDTKRKNPRVYSYSPISRTRLTVPKRQFSPEPVRKTAKILIGPRRVTETVHLSDLTKILCKLKAGEFSLPHGFTLKYKKRFADESKSETVSVNLQLLLPNFKIVMKFSISDGRDLDDSLQLSSESNIESESKNETSVKFNASVNIEHIVISEQKEETGTSKSHDQSKHRRGRKRLNMNSTTEKIFPINSIAETHATARGKPRKRAALIKLKRGKSHKNLIFHISASENTSNSDSSKNVPLTLSSSETFIKDPSRESSSNASKSTVYVSHDGNHGDGSDEHEDSKIEVLDSGMSMIFSNVVDRTETGNAGKMDDIFDAVKDDDYDDGERLHIVETVDEDESCDTDNRFFEVKKERDLVDIVTDIVNKLIDQVCEARSLGVNLITEPLRRPSTVATEESRRVPPLRIRIPQKRESRQRRPARVHDYSPPLPVSRIHRLEETGKKRTAITPTQVSGDIAEIRQKRSMRNKESQRKNSLSNKEADTYSPFPQCSNRKSSVLSSPIYISSPSPVLVGSSNEEDIIPTPSAIYEGPSDAETNQQRALKFDVFRNAITLHWTQVSKEDMNVNLQVDLHLYPSLFSRRRKSNTVKTPAVTQLNVFDSIESDSIVQLKSGTEDNDTVSSGCLPSKQKRKRGQNSITDNEHADDKSFGEKLGLDKNVYDYDEEKDQVNSFPGSSNLTNYNSGSCIGASKKVLTDMTKAESSEDAVEVNRSAEKTRRISNNSVQDGGAPSVSEGGEQDTTVSSTSSRRRKMCLDSEGTNDLSSNQSVSRSQRRKSSTIVDVDTGKLDGNDVTLASNRLRNKRSDSKSTSDKMKQKVSHQNMPYFKRISQRRKLNPLAIGLKSRSGDDNPSFFIEKFFCEGLSIFRDDLKKEDAGDVIVDVDSEPTIEGDDEMPNGRLAITVALEINKITPRPEMNNEDKLEAENFDHEYLLTLDNVRTMFSSEVLDRKRLLNDMLTVISSQYCSEISSQNVFGGASIRYNTMVKNAHRLRDKVLLFTKDQRENAKWAHQIFLKHLAVPMLATYIDLLRFCKTVGRYLLDFFLEQNSTDKTLNKMNACIQDFISEKVIDPQTIPISKTLTKRHAKNICLLTVSPTFTHAEYHSRSRSHEYMFRVLLPNVADRVEAVRLNLPATRDISICEAVDHCIRLVSRKVVEVHRKYPDLKIVLVGWGHLVVQCMPNVSAIINFAFPMKTADGPRGDVDDDILLTYCPTLFVIGDQATDCDVRELQVMATRMIAPTGVIVIGSSNCDLHPSTLRLTIERFTHRTVQRALLDDVVDFLQLYCSSSSTHSFRLHPLKLVEVNDVDLSILRTSNLSLVAKPNQLKSVLHQKLVKEHCIGLNGHNFPECYMSHSCTETRISNESVAFLECCRERRLPEVCLRKCSYANYNQNSLRRMFLQMDPCPLLSANDIHFCAAQDHDHRQCCITNGVTTTLAGQKCLIFCDQRMQNGTILDRSYLPCLERFEPIKECFWHWARKRYQLMELSKKSRINESKMSTDYIIQFSTKQPPSPF
ncbi:DB module [Dirofilaria immitis]|nr:DB module [Dirofilaria immitis]